MYSSRLGATALVWMEMPVALTVTPFPRKACFVDSVASEALWVKM